MMNLRTGDKVEYLFNRPGYPHKGTTAIVVEIQRELVLLQFPRRTGRNRLRGYGWKTEIKNVRLISENLPSINNCLALQRKLNNLK